MRFTITIDLKRHRPIAIPDTHHDKVLGKPEQLVIPTWNASTEDNAMQIDYIRVYQSIH